MHANVGDRIVIKGHRIGRPCLTVATALATTPEEVAVDVLRHLGVG